MMAPSAGECYRYRVELVRSSWWCGHGAEWALYDALRALERGEATSFEVINVDDWTANRRLVTRKVEIPARR
jgi:hypothetical protein